MSDKPTILVQLDTDPLPSVFDRVVAVDAGVQHLFSYGGITPQNVMALVHGCIFTRGGKDLARISFTGRVLGVKGKEATSGGKVEGVALFDVADGFVTEARVDVSFDMDLRFADEVVAGLGTLRAEAKRVPGDLIAKDFPPIGGGPRPFPGGGTGKIVTPLAKSKLLWGTNAALTLGLAVAAGGAVGYVMPDLDLLSGVWSGVVAGLLVASLHALFDQLPELRGRLGAFSATALPVAVGGTLIFVVGRVIVA